MKWTGLALLLLCGCPHRHPELHFGPGGEITDPQKLMALLSHREQAFQTLTGDARLHVDSAQGSGTVKQFVAVGRPASLHIESFDFFGRPLSALVSDGQTFSLYDADKAVFYQGPATAQSVMRFLPVAMPPEQIVALMLGDVPRVPDAAARMELDTERAEYRLFLDHPPVTQTLEVAVEDLEVSRSTTTGPQGYLLEHGDYQSTPSGEPFPHQIAFTQAAPGAHALALRYRYTDVALNKPLDPAQFTQKPPGGAKVVDLDAAGNEVAQ